MLNKGALKFASGNGTKVPRMLWIAAAASLFWVGQASATVMGTLTENACSGGGVTVSATTITWLPAIGSGQGCIDTGAATALTWSGGGTLGPAVQGAIKDLTAGPPATVDNFIDLPFPGTLLDFQLTSLGPGSAAVGMAACQAASTDNTKTCSVFAGSPIILSLSGTTSTTATLGATLFIADPNNAAQGAIFNGGFSVTIAGQTPIQVYNDFTTNGNKTVGNQGQWVFTSAVPEPGTVSMFLFGGGLLAASAILRKIRA